MAFDNGVNFCGRLTAEPELKTVGENTVCNFTLARNKYVKGKDHPEADFIDFVAWNGTAEFLCKYFKKGSRVGVQGELASGSYTDKDGNKRKKVEVRVNGISFVDSKNDSDSNTNNDVADDGLDDGLPF